MARRNEKAMLALNLPHMSPLGETLLQSKTPPQLPPSIFANRHPGQYMFFPGVFFVFVHGTEPHWVIKQRGGGGGRVCACGGAMTYMNEDAKGGEPRNGDDKVKWPVDEARGEGDEPYQGYDDGYSCDYFGIYEAPEAPGVLVGPREDPARDAGDDGGEDQLRRAEDDVDDTGENHSFFRESELLKEGVCFERNLTRCLLGFL